jgi:hypothetical protein
MLLVNWAAGPPDPFGIELAGKRSILSLTRVAADGLPPSSRLSTSAAANSMKSSNAYSSLQNYAEESEQYTQKLLRGWSILVIGAAKASMQRKAGSATSGSGP